MTAFSRVQRQHGTNVLCWELKSVNHRYLDVSFRLPESFRSLETTLRHALRGQLHRGKLECQLKLNHVAENDQTVLVNEGLAVALLEAADKLASMGQIQNDVTTSYLLSWPGVIQTDLLNMESLYQPVEALFQAGVDALLDARLQEGNTLKACIKDRIALLNKEIAGALSTVSATADNTRNKLHTRLRNLQVDVDAARMEQEIALLLTKLDVSEELDRLQSHADEVVLVLDKKDAVGRQLDFLMQELNREANTLGSKSDSIALTQHAVQMKVLIEQMREQLQNIE